MMRGFFSKAESVNSPIPVGFCLFSEGRQNKRAEWGRCATRVEFIRTQSAEHPLKMKDGVNCLQSFQGSNFSEGFRGGHAILPEALFPSTSKLGFL